MLLEVRDVQPVRDYVLRVEFVDGAVRELHLRDELYGEMFEPLRDPELFAAVQVNVEAGTIERPNGADFAPEFLASIGREVKRVA
jgi:hypothetical protein